MASKKKVVIPIIVILAAGAAFVWYNSREQTLEERTELTLHGNVDIRQVELAFNGNERITQMPAEEGDRVKKGQLVGQLDDTRLKAAVARSEGQVESQRQVVARMLAGTREEEIRKARADAEAAKVEAANADLQFARMKALYEGNAIDKKAMDDARTAAEASHARLKALEEVLALAVAGPRKEDIASAQATLKAMEAELGLAKKNLADAQLFAPCDGTIRTRVLEPGDMASPQKPAYTIAPDDPVWVRAYVDERDLGRVKAGMKAYAETDTFPGKKYEGWVGFISPTAQFTPKNVETPEVRTTLVYEIRVFIRNPNGELRLGMPATVIIPLYKSAAAESVEGK